MWKKCVLGCRIDVWTLGKHHVQRDGGNVGLGTLILDIHERQRTVRQMWTHLHCSCRNTCRDPTTRQTLPSYMQSMGTKEEAKVVHRVHNSPRWLETFPWGQRKTDLGSWCDNKPLWQTSYNSWDAMICLNPYLSEYSQAKQKVFSNFKVKIHKWYELWRQRFDKNASLCLLIAEHNELLIFNYTYKTKKVMIALCRK